MRKTIFFILFILVTAFIFSNSAKPAAQSSSQSGFFVNIFLSIFPEIGNDIATVIIRKLAHVSEFFAQGALLSGIFFENYRKKLGIVLLVGLMTACTDELIQLFFEGRGAMLTDVFIDFMGTVLSVVMVSLIYFKRVRK